MHQGWEPGSLDVVVKAAALTDLKGQMSHGRPVWAMLPQFLTESVVADILPCGIWEHMSNVPKRLDNVVTADTRLAENAQGMSLS